MPMIMRISFDIETQDDVHAALERLHALLGEAPATAVKEVAVEKVPAEPSKAKKVKVEESSAPITLQDLSQHLRKLALDHGDQVQDAIAGIILEISGTQALSQVEPELYGNIKLAVDRWVRDNL